MSRHKRTAVYTRRRKKESYTVTNANKRQLLVKYLYQARKVRDGICLLWISIVSLFLRLCYCVLEPAPYSLVFVCFSFNQIYEDNTIILIYFIENKSELSHIKLSTICKMFKCINGYARKNLKRDILSKYKHLKNLKPLIVTFLSFSLDQYTNGMILQ